MPGGRGFFGVVVLGAAVRAYLVVCTPGTYDVGIWESHARAVLESGLTEAYRTTPQLNHPPLACWIAALLSALAERSGIPFAVLLRAPIAALDLGSVFLLARLLRDQPKRWLIAGAYALHPVAILLSGYHGNTDSAIAFFLLLAVIQAGESRAALAGLAVGASAALKLPGLLALPAVVLSFARTRDRLTCAGAALAAGAVTYVPMLALDPRILWERVFAYRGQGIQTTAREPVWGPMSFLAPFFGDNALTAFAQAWLDYDSLVIAAPILAFAWLRRARPGATHLGQTLAFSYAAVYGFSTRFAFQYFAWSVPLWLVAGRGFALGASLVATVYLYGLYAWLCGDLLLRGAWDFAGHPHWPLWLVIARDVGVLFFMLATVLELARAWLVAWAPSR